MRDVLYCSPSPGRPSLSCNSRLPSQNRIHPPNPSFNTQLIVSTGSQGPERGKPRAPTHPSRTLKFTRRAILEKTTSYASTAKNPLNTKPEQPRHTSWNPGSSITTELFGEYILTTRSPTSSAVQVFSGEILTKRFTQQKFAQNSHSIHKNDEVDAPTGNSHAT